MRQGWTCVLGAAVLAGLAGAAAAQDGGPPPPGAMPPAMGGRLQAAFAMMDTNHDGAVTRDEYDAFRAARRARMQGRRGDYAPPPPPPPGDGGPPPPPPGGRGMRGGRGMGMGMGGRDWFALADANHDGRVTQPEMQAFAQTMMQSMMARGPRPGGPPPPPPRGDATGPGYQLPAGSGAPGYDTGAGPPPRL